MTTANIANGQIFTELEICRLLKLTCVILSDPLMITSRYSISFNQASRGPLHKAAIRGEYRMVKIRVECGEDVDQKDQVLVFSSLCNFCAKP